MPQNGIQSVTVPGCVDGWEKLHGKFGKLPWRDLFQPAIYYAENGFPVTELIAGGWSGRGRRLKRTRTAGAFFCRRGERRRWARSSAIRNWGARSS